MFVAEGTIIGKVKSEYIGLGCRKNGTIFEKLRGDHCEWSHLGGPKVKTRGATGPKGPKVFGRGAYQGTPFTMIAPRLFHIMSLFQHHKQEFVIFSANEALREYHVNI